MTWRAKPGFRGPAPRTALNPALSEREKRAVLPPLPLGRGKGLAPRKSESGFTLIEVIIVVVILGLVAGLVLARGPAHSRTLDARAAAADVVRVLRGARGQAISTDRSVLVLVDTVRHAIAVDGGTAKAIPGNFAIAVQAVPAERRSRTLAGIRFQPDGSASGGKIVLGDGARRTEIAINWLTGRVSVADAPAS